MCSTPSKPKGKKEESLFSHNGLEVKEHKQDSDVIIGGYIATTHRDSGFHDPDRNMWVRDRIRKETLESWSEQLNDGNPRANKASVNHVREKQVTGVAVKGSARVDKLPDGEYGLWVETLIDKTKPNFDDTAYRLDKGLLDSFSIEFTTKDPITDGYITGAVTETQLGNGIYRDLLPNTILEGYTLASQPMNEYAVRMKETVADEVNKPEIKMEEHKMVDQVTEVKQIGLTDEDRMLLKEIREKKKEDSILDMKESIKAELKAAMDKAPVENKVAITPTMIEKKEFTDYRNVLEAKNRIDVSEQFRIAGRFAEAKGMFDHRDWVTSAAEKKEFKFSTNGNKLEFKGLGLTTNQNSDTDYLLSAAELSDVFDPVIYNALNQKTVTWNILQKDDYSSKGNNLVQFKLKIGTNSTAGAYTGNAINTGNVSRLNFQTKFKKYQVGVEIDGDMIAAARGGPIGDVFAQEVKDSTDDLMSVMNQALFPTSAYLATETCAETAADVISFEAIADSAGNTTLYNLTRSTTNRLSPAAAGDTYINGSSADLSITNLRAAKRQAIEEGASLQNLVFIGSPIQGDKLRSIYDEAQRLVPTSSRYGFEGMMSFDGIPFFEDKDCNDDDVFLIDLETHRIAIWVPPTLEMLGKDADSQKGFIKTYWAVYNRCPRRLVMIYGNATS